MVGVIYIACTYVGIHGNSAQICHRPQSCPSQTMFPYLWRLAVTPLELGARVLLEEVRFPEQRKG